MSRDTELENDSRPLTKVFDSHETTFWDTFRSMAAEFYSNNITLPTKFSAKIYRVEKNISNFDGSPQSQMHSEMGIDNTQCKVWLEGGAYNLYCKPKTFDATPEDRILCNSLRDVSVQRDKLPNLDRGQSVVVTSQGTGDLQNLTIDYTYSDKTNGEKPKGTADASNPSSGFSNKSPQP